MPLGGSAGPQPGRSPQARSGMDGQGIHVQFLKESLIFTGQDSPMANPLLGVMGAFAQFERELIQEGQREGIALA